MEGAAEQETGQGELSGVRLSADVGGTFTDTAVFDPSNGQIRYGKTLTTPRALIEGVRTGVEKAETEFSDTGLFLHGTTIAINTVLERSGARTAILTTRGFRDIYEIGRVNRPDAYNLFFRKHEPLVSRALRFEVDERLSADGDVLVPLNEDQVGRIAEALSEMGIEAIAILFLHSYRDPRHEIRAREIVAERCPDVFVTASHELSQEYREFERTSTVAANAYLGPRVKSYLNGFTDFLESSGFPGSFLVVQSTGGLYTADRARRECIRMLESGPAAGLIGSRALCRQMDLPNAIAFDMGGTTAKAGVVYDHEVLMTGSSMIGGYETGLPVQIPMIDIQEVGTGGGSIARLTPGGGLRVGPQSAGADPGPICYGLGGTEPTVTDANLLLGRLSASQFLGGEMALDVAAAEAGLRDRVADPLGLSVTKAAEGVLQIATTTMAHVVRRVTTERGLDAADFSMIAYGGAGPLHATMVARELQIDRVIIPNSPGHFSAFGMLMSDFRHDEVRSWFRKLKTIEFEEMDRIFAEMEDAGRKAIAAGGVSLSGLSISRAADMRYVGQEHAVTAELPASLFDSRDMDGIKAAFDAVHAVRYGYSSPEEPAEIVSLRSSVSGVLAKPDQTAIGSGGEEPASDALRETRPVFFGSAGAFVDTPVYERSVLKSGNKIAGPALVEEYASTTVIHPGDVLSVDRQGNLLIEIGRVAS